MTSATSRARFAQARYNRQLVGLQNQLPETVVTARSLNSFKARLDEYLSTGPGGQLTELIRSYVT